ncbi:nitrilase-related carbon-nitrogen hydrolase [Pseudonocardia sp. TRM90224]|uniref:nitrilase-related carbon-nitrogen hydrolase n=1 Tax=Pseudonocardia sp. TRM90224 TaxID=2812678 RepID=UPI001E5741E4|nr:nitrilase-related carbon-nitrogen hydrolase [Pseudonocardia sp. TRM90224]
MPVGVVPVTVAAVQVPAAMGERDPGRALAMLTAAVRDAAGRGARLVVLPELAACGYTFRDAAEARAAAEPLASAPTVARLRELSRDLGCVLVAGLAELGDDGEVYNTAVLVEGGQVRAGYRKVHLWGGEAELFRPGTQPPAVVDTAAGRVGVMICYDLEFPEWVRLAAEAGAEIVAVPANWPALPVPAGERPLEVIKAQAAAGAYRVHVVVADRCGRERGVDWTGGSIVCGADGYLRAGPATEPEAPAAPAILLAELDPAAARDKSLGPHNDALRDRRPGLYGGG